MRARFVRALQVFAIGWIVISLIATFGLRHYQFGTNRLIDSFFVTAIAVIGTVGGLLLVACMVFMLVAVVLMSSIPVEYVLTGRRLDEQLWANRLLARLLGETSTPEPSLVTEQTSASA